MNQVLYIWLDDVRPLPQKLKVTIDGMKVFWTKSVQDAESFLIANNTIENPNPLIILDLDHDLGLDQDGYDFCKWIVKQPFPTGYFMVHSMNPVGAQNMRNILLDNNWKEIK